MGFGIEHYQTKRESSKNPQRTGFYRRSIDIMTILCNILTPNLPDLHSLELYWL